jgi:chromosome partitioning protein
MESQIKVVVFLNNKGGVAKTTTTSLYAEYASIIEKKRVLIIDFDGQCNLTSQWIGHDMISGEREPIVNPDISADDLVEYNARSAITDIFRGKSVESYLTQIGSGDKDDIACPRVEIVACSGSGMKWIQETLTDGSEDDVDAEGRQLVRGVPTSKVIKAMYDFCHAPIMTEFYDLILIDTGPGVNTLFRAALNAATHVVAPYVPENFSVLGIGPLIHQIESANRNRFTGGEPIELVGLLPSKVDTRSAVHMEVIEEMSQHPGLKGIHFPADLFVPASVHIARRSQTNRPVFDPYSIFEMKPSEPIRKKAEQVFSHMHQRVFSSGNGLEGAA